MKNIIKINLDHESYMVRIYNKTLNSNQIHLNYEKTLAYRSIINKN